MRILYVWYGKTKQSLVALLQNQVCSFNRNQPTYFTKNTLQLGSFSAWGVSATKENFRLLSSLSHSYLDVFGIWDIWEYLYTIFVFSPSLLVEFLLIVACRRWPKAVSCKSLVFYFECDCIYFSSKFLCSYFFIWRSFSNP